MFEAILDVVDQLIEGSSQPEITLTWDGNKVRISTSGLSQQEYEALRPEILALKGKLHLMKGGIPK